MSHKNRDIRPVYKLLSGRYQELGASGKISITGCHPAEHLSRLLAVGQARSLPHRAQLQNKQIDLFHRKGGVCFILLFAQCPGGGSW